MPRHVHVRQAPFVTAKVHLVATPETSYTALLLRVRSVVPDTAHGAATIKGVSAIRSEHLHSILLHTVADIVYDLGHRQSIRTKLSYRCPPPSAGVMTVPLHLLPCLALLPLASASDFASFEVGRTIVIVVICIVATFVVIGVIGTVYRQVHLRNAWRRRQQPILPLDATGVSHFQRRELTSKCQQVNYPPPVEPVQHPPPAYMHNPADYSYVR